VPWPLWQAFALLAALRFCPEEGGAEMDGLGNLISTLDYILDTKRKRHITGGILLSVSILFGGLALTVMTIKNEEGSNE
jgi:hypothetical protein